MYSDSAELLTPNDSTPIGTSPLVWPSKPRPPALTLDHARLNSFQGPHPNATTVDLGRVPDRQSVAIGSEPRQRVPDLEAAVENHDRLACKGRKKNGLQQQNKKAMGGKPA